MKKLVVVLCIMLMTGLVLAGCSGSGSGGEDSGAPEPKKGVPKEVQELKTMGEVASFAKEYGESEDGSGMTEQSVGGGHAVYVFKYKDTLYRAIADITQKFENKYFKMTEKLNDSDEDKEMQMLAPLEVSRMENLSEQIIPQEELDKLVGKTGKELVDEGWSYDGSYNLEDMGFEMNKGSFIYTVTFEGTVEGGNTDDFDPEKETRDRKVKAVKFSMLGYAAPEE